MVETAAGAWDSRHVTVRRGGVPGLVCFQPYTGSQYVQYLVFVLGRCLAGACTVLVAASLTALLLYLLPPAPQGPKPADRIQKGEAQNAAYDFEEKINFAVFPSLQVCVGVRLCVCLHGCVCMFNLQHAALLVV